MHGSALPHDARQVKDRDDHQSRDDRAEKNLVRMIRDTGEGSENRGPEPSGNRDSEDFEQSRAKMPPPWQRPPYEQAAESGAYQAW